MKKRMKKIQKDLKIVKEAMKIFRDRERIQDVQQLIIFDSNIKLKISTGETKC